MRASSARSGGTPATDVDHCVGIGRPDDATSIQSDAAARSRANCCAIIVRSAADASRIVLAAESAAKGALTEPPNPSASATSAAGVAM